MWNTLTSGQARRGSLTNKKKDGSLYQAELSVSPVHNQSGEITNFVGVMRDISNEAQLERQLRQTQKMDALGIIAGGIAHDFNNILAVMLGFIQLTIDLLEEGSKEREYLMETLIAGNRATELVRQILAFRRSEEGEAKPMCITQVVKETINMMRSVLPANIKIIDQLDPVCRSVLANQTQIHQLTMNLCTNAHHAMEDGGTLSVTLEEIEHQQEHSNDLSGPFVSLSISDTGVGIAPEVVDHIFEPFYTTKTKNKGTGLGLSVVHGIVKGLGGEMFVKSTLAEGTTFQVIFPIIDEAPVVTLKQVNARKGHERILVVDDEISIGKYMKIELENHGYQVTVQSNSEQALTLLQQHPKDFDLVVTDYNMPDLGGLQLSQQILEIAPKTPIIMVTGYTDNISKEEIKAFGIKEYMLKPINIAELTQTIGTLV